MLHLRRALPTDIASIAAIEAEPPVVGDVYSVELLKLMVPSTFCAVENGTVIGFITAHRLTPSVLKREKKGFKYNSRVPKKGMRLKDVLKVVNIKVRVSHQNKGIGKTMVRFALNASGAHRVVEYETPFSGTHVIATCLSAQEYVMLPNTQKKRAYDCGAKTHSFCFERVI